MPLSILVVDDDPTIRETLVEFFEALGHRARGAATATAGRQAVAEDAPDVALVDLRLPDASGLRLFETLRADDPEVAVIFLTGHADVPTAVQAMRQGAADFLEKPVALETLEAAVARAAEHGRLRRELAVLRAGGGTTSAAASTPSVERLVALAAQNADAPVLILGETGTGKGYVARRIHDQSTRAASAFVEINCATLSPTFVESELFGHERGAFTDAKQAKRGLFEVAGRGTVFLDEVGELATDVQPKLLKAIEEGAFRRLGGTVELRSEARLVCATHQPLATLVAERRFRADLFYRLQVLTITLPPLRERPGELTGLADQFLPRGAALTAAARAALAAYRWPGNIRELKNALWRAAILADGAPIAPEHLGLGATGPAEGDGGDAPLTLEAAERAAVERALAATGGNRVRAAQLLGIARSTLGEKLRRYGASA
jgi:two-component system response regulator HydG